jgi:lipoate-protein ligase A
MPLIELADADPLPTAGQALDRLKRMAAAVGKTHRPPSILIWRAERALIVTRREARLPGFARAARQMASAGWPVLVRESGGSACAVGPGTVQIALVFARPRDGVSLDTVYDALARPILSAISRFDVDGEVAPVPASFCSGRHDIAVKSRKIAGLAQQWQGPAGRGGYVVVAASVIIDQDPAELASAVNRFANLCDRPERCRASAITALAREVEAPGAGLTSRFLSCLRDSVASTSFTVRCRLDQ